MSLPTCAVVCTVFDDSGAPVSGATITAKLNRYEVYNGYVVPQVIQGTTNDAGTCTLNLWPNALGSTESSYVVKIAAPNGKNLTTTALVPNVSTMPLHLIANLPPYDGKSDGQLVIDAAIEAGATAVAKATEAADSATAAAASATSASNSATSASTSATTATTKASEAAASAASASTSAATATTQASTATTKATQAAASASDASTYAATASTKASEAAASATSASNSASTATTKASEAASSATSASSSQSAAAGSATSAATSASNAASSATAAAGSATSASTSASTATTKASEAATSASNAATSATSAASSATSASNSASTATTKASEAATSATTATNKAGEASTSATNAATSATAASNSATSAATSATSAQASSTSASGYATTASNQATIATTKAAEAAASAQAAADSAAVASSGGIRFDVAQSLTAGQQAQARSNIGVNLGVANGVATLDSGGKVPSSQLPSYVDDVLEYTSTAAFPGTGETGKIYVAIDTNKTYRWTGSIYVEISASPGSTDAVTEGATNLYFTNARARSAISVTGSLSYNSTTGVITGPDLSGYLTSTTAAITYLPLTGGTLTGPSVVSVNSASNALRVTQVGSGNAILVEDSANPDSTPFVVNADGVVVVGASSAQSFPAGDGANRTASTQIQGSLFSTSTIAAALYNTAASVGGATLSLAKSNNATVGSHSIVANGDVLGVVNFSGSDGTAFVRAANIFAQVDGAPGTNDMPGRLVFSTTADGASSPTERMRIDSAGRVGIGGTPSSSQKFLLTGNTTGAATVAAQLISNTFLSDVTFSGRGIWTSLSTQAAAFTLHDLTHYFASQGTIGAGSTVTNQYGFNVSSGLTGATNNYGFYSNIASGTGRWNFYAAGTADNYFAGKVGVGTATPAVSLHIGGTDAIRVANGTTAQRPASAAAGDFRYNSTLDQFEGYTSAIGWGAIGGGGGAKGGGSDAIFYTNGKTITTDYTIPTNENAGTFGPITHSSGVVTINDGSVWTVN